MIDSLIECYQEPDIFKDKNQSKLQNIRLLERTVLLRYLISGKRSKRQRALPTSAGLALIRWVRFMFLQRHLRWKRARGYFALPPYHVRR